MQSLNLAVVTNNSQYYIHTLSFQSVVSPTRDVKQIISQYIQFTSYDSLNIISLLYMFFHCWQIVPAWLSCLPIKSDIIEAKIVHEQLCSMVER